MQKINVLKLLTCYVFWHTPLGGQTKTRYSICIDLSYDPNLIMIALFTDLLVVLTFECLILFKIMLFDYVWVLSEHLQHPVYALCVVGGTMNLHCISDVKKTLTAILLKTKFQPEQPCI